MLISGEGEERASKPVSLAGEVVDWLLDGSSDALDPSEEPVLWYERLLRLEGPAPEILGRAIVADEEQSAPCFRSLDKFQVQKLSMVKALESQ